MGLDSLEWVMLLEDELGVQIPDEEAEKLHTLRPALDFIAPRVDPRAWPRDRVGRRLLEISARQFGVPLSRVSLDSHIVRDLGAD